MLDAEKYGKIFDLINKEFINGSGANNPALVQQLINTLQPVIHDEIGFKMEGRNMDPRFFRKYIDILTESMDLNQLAAISDKALDDAYNYGRSSPGNTFGWQANLKSAEFAKKAIESGVTDIEVISDAIHKGWNVTAKAFVQNPGQFDDTEKLRAAGKLEAKLAQREKLMNIPYAQLSDEEQEKDRVVARALLAALSGNQEQPKM